MKVTNINKKKKFIIITIIVFIVVGAVYFMGGSHRYLVENKSDTSNTPVFSFNSKVAPDWWAGSNFDSRDTVTKGYKGSTPVEKLPIAGRVINQGGTKEQPINGCFVMYSYYNYSDDTAALRKAREDGMTAKSELMMQRGGMRDMSINTIDGIKTYQLYQYGLSGPGSDTMMRGVELGYVNLTNGYISVEGDCQDSSELDSTISAIGSISLTMMPEDI